MRGANQHLAQGSQQGQQLQPPGYFDNATNLHKSTVGSASATGSAGGRTTWVSGGDSDKMSEDQDDGISSAGMSDEGNASLVGFGEGAGSTVSGPTSTLGRTTLGKECGGVGSPTSGKQYNKDSGSPMQVVED